MSKPCSTPQPHSLIFIDSPSLTVRKWHQRRDYQWEPHNLQKVRTESASSSTLEMSGIHLNFSCGYNLVTSQMGEKIIHLICLGLHDDYSPMELRTPKSADFSASYMELCVSLCLTEPKGFRKMGQGRANVQNQKSVMNKTRF